MYSSLATTFSHRRIYTYITYILGFTPFVIKCIVGESSFFRIFYVDGTYIQIYQLVDRGYSCIFNYMKSNKKYELCLKRRDMVSQGAYDGRFTSKVVVDKKKQLSKDGAKKWKIDRD